MIKEWIEIKVENDFGVNVVEEWNKQIANLPFYKIYGHLGSNYNSKGNYINLSISSKRCELYKIAMAFKRKFHKKSTKPELSFTTPTREKSTSGSDNTENPNS